MQKRMELATNEERGKGKFLVLEGVDGSGISTQAARLQSWLQEKTGTKVLLTKEPSDGPVGMLIRQALTGRVQGFDSETLALLFAADRIDHLAHRVLPAVRNGHHVVCDRYLLSSLAYQGQTLTQQWIKEINAKAIEPDLTLFIRVDPGITLSRISNNRFQVDLFERENILREVLHNYDRLISEQMAKGGNIVEIDGSRPLEEVTQNIRSTVESYFFGNNF